MQQHAISKLNLQSLVEGPSHHILTHGVLIDEVPLI